MNDIGSVWQGVKYFQCKMIFMENNLQWKTQFQNQFSVVWFDVKNDEMKGKLKGK